MNYYLPEDPNPTEISILLSTLTDEEFDSFSDCISF